MAKTYIFGPTEIAFQYNSVNGYLESTVSTDWYDLSEGATLQFDNAVFKYATTDTFERYFTEDGNDPEEEPDSWASIFNNTDEAAILLKLGSLPTEDCTLTVSLYTGEDDPEPTPGGDIPETIANLSKNVTYELHPHNDIDRIRFKGNLTNKED